MQPRVRLVRPQSFEQRPDRWSSAAGWPKKQIRSDVTTKSLLAFDLCCSLVATMKWDLAQADANKASLRASDILRTLLLPMPRPALPGLRPGVCLRRAASAAFAMMGTRSDFTYAMPWIGLPPSWSLGCSPSATPTTAWWASWWLTLMTCHSASTRAARMSWGRFRNWRRS
eukprot:13500845-Alexandrium_andersonii.AAC.1